MAIPCNTIEGASGKNTDIHDQVVAHVDINYQSMLHVHSPLIIAGVNNSKFSPNFDVSPDNYFIWPTVVMECLKFVLSRAITQQQNVNGQDGTAMTRTK